MKLRFSPGVSDSAVTSAIFLLLLEEKLCNIMQNYELRIKVECSYLVSVVRSSVKFIKCENNLSFLHLEFCLNIF